MGIFGNKEQQPAAPQYTAQQYVAAGHNMRAAQRWSEAMECYRAAANMKDPEGLYWLANCVLTGKGAQQNDLLACQLYSLAARMQHPQATETLFKYMDATIRDSLKTNDFKGLAPYVKAGAEGGHIQSIYLHGYCLTAGVDGAPNKQEGYQWIKLAADNGYTLAQEALRKYF